MCFIIFVDGVREGVVAMRNVKVVIDVMFFRCVFFEFECGNGWF